MAAYVVYLDHEHAKIFKMIPGEKEETKMERHEVRHHQNNQDEKHRDSDKFYHEVAGKLKGAGEILVIGHGTAKKQFVGHLEKHNHADLSKKVVGVEAADKPTDNQILAFARKFFQKQHLYT